MDQENSLSYYVRREADARMMADRTSNHEAKRIHTDLADRYAAKVGEMMARPTRGLA